MAKFESIKANSPAAIAASPFKKGGEDEQQKNRLTVSHEAVFSDKVKQKRVFIAPTNFQLHRYESNHRYVVTQKTRDLRLHFLHRR